MNSQVPSLESQYVAQLRSILPNLKLKSDQADQADEEFEVVLSAIEYIRYLHAELKARGLRC